MTACGCEPDETAALERKTLWALLAINGVMFIVEAAVGWWAESAALMADALDMFADASVYGVALFAVARSRHLQANAATASGILQIALGIGVLVEVVRRFLYGSDPVSVLMMVVGTIALIANVSCLVLIAKHREGGVHMRASWIFSTNDVIANVGVIISGGLVMYLGNRFPDLLIGALISVIVLRGGFHILREAKESRAGEVGA
jgi:cation diffusion facilitator family transporter